LSSRLAGRAKVIVARSRDGNRDLAARLRKAGIDSVSVDTIEFLPTGDPSAVDSALTRLFSFDWVAFTSATAVSVFAGRMAALGLNLSNARPKIAAVGARTAIALKKAGFRVSYTPSRYLTSELGMGLPINDGTRILLLRADIATATLPAILKERGFEVEDVAIYRTRTPKKSLNQALFEGADLVVFASPSEVQGFRELVPGNLFQRLARSGAAACIGPVTAKAAEEAGFSKVIVPNVQTIDELVEVIGGHLVHA